MTDPGRLFAEEVEEERYQYATSVLETRTTGLCQLHRELTPLREALAHGDIHLAYVWDAKPFEIAKEEIVHNSLAYVAKAPGLWSALSGYDAAVVVRRHFWEEFDEQARAALLFHELLHIVFTDRGWKLRKHDLEEFASVVRHYGSWLPDRRAFLRSWLDWQREQDTPSAAE